jgi:hypothetical protein
MDTVSTFEVDPNFSYPEKWTYAEYLCACGLRIRVGAEVMLGPCAPEEYQHGSHDVKHMMPGSVFAVWELRGDDWILTSPP